MFVIGTCICRIAWVGARLYASGYTIPAGIDSFRLCEDAFPVAVKVAAIMRATE
jgi:hypothetical protein